MLARSATAAVLLGAAAGCGAGTEPVPVLMELVPIAAYNDAPVAATIYGGSFRPAYAFDTGSGSATVTTGGYAASLTLSGVPGSKDLQAVSWESTHILGGQIPPGLAAGTYDLVVRDPSGRLARLPGAFRSLGADGLAPAVAIVGPVSGGIVAAGATVPVVVTANDGGGLGALRSLTVTVTTAGASVYSPGCQVTGGATGTCAFTFRAPAPGAAGATLVIDATATGAGGQIGETQLALALAPAPTITGVDPNSGSTLGGGTVTVYGTGFLPGATQVTFDGSAASLLDQSATSLTVVTPAQPLPGPAAVTVSLGGAGATLPTGFMYVAPPAVRELDPASGPAAGLFPITVVGSGFRTKTQILFGAAPLICPRVINANRIQGFAPPGAGTEPVTATDPDYGAMPGAPVPFNYTGGTPGDGGVPAAAIPDGACPAGDAGLIGDGGP